MSLSATIKSIQDIMRKNVGVDGDAQDFVNSLRDEWDEREQQLGLQSSWMMPFDYSIGFFWIRLR